MGLSVPPQGDPVGRGFAGPDIWPPREEALQVRL